MELVRLTLTTAAVTLIAFLARRRICKLVRSEILLIMPRQMNTMVDITYTRIAVPNKTPINANYYI